MEVLGAVASAVALAGVSVKGLKVLRKLRDIDDDFAALGQEVSAFYNDPQVTQMARTSKTAAEKTKDKLDRRNRPVHDANDR
jgi:hypothetical protein